MLASSATNVSAGAAISVDKPRSLVDEKIDIQVTGLPGNSPVTLRLQITEPYGSFSAFGHYVADPHGRLNLASCSSSAGTYTGVDGMGLFWSLRQESTEKPGLRLLRREAASPMTYQLAAFAGHVTWEQLLQPGRPDSAMCTASLQRTYLDESVLQIPIRFGRLRGTLFKPRNRAACPPIIDLFGTGGGLMEHRAALLAKEGFTVLALAFFNYQDLPKELRELDMEYFEEAVDFMLASPYCQVPSPSGRGGVGIIGVSAGADIVANAAILFGDKIRAAVWINGTVCRNWFPMRYRGSYLPHQMVPDLSRVRPAEPNPVGIDFRDCVCHGCGSDREVPVELATCRFLFFSCLDDYSVSPESGERLAERLRRAGRADFERVAYPNAGHLLEPPISPCTPLCYHGVFKVHMYYGGQAEGHHAAQVDSWARMIRLFREELGDVSGAAARL